ncbi:MAG: chorismate synthase [Christensenellaceae bacterium]|nr:chorismate synthase [Christensenellaceae bacterium]
MILSNKGLNLKIFGESHSEYIGLKLSGIDSGIKIDFDKLQSYVNRRKSVKANYSTTRIESDKLIVKGGFDRDTTNGQCIEIVIKNENIRSHDYENLQAIPRPSHADYPYYVKTGGKACIGGGKFSGRMTLPLVIGGGIAVQILESYNISLYAHILEIGGIKSFSFSKDNITIDSLSKIKDDAIPVLSCEAKESILDAIAKASSSANSLGGIVEVVAFGVPVGIGDALFDGFESCASAILFGIPAVKGVEFGAGFDISRMPGDKANDCYQILDGKIVTKTNNCGGIVGGMTNGMPIIVRAAFKPTPSIGMIQNSVDLKTMKEVTLKIEGRHDTCFLPRAVVAVEAAIALSILDTMKCSSIKE